MSPITALLSGRMVEHTLHASHAPALASPQDPSRGLHELVEGEAAMIVRVAHASDAATARRLFDLGFTPGAAVTTVRRAPFGGPAVYRVADYEIALRPAQARTITIVTLAPAAGRA